MDFRRFLPLRVEVRPGARCQSACECRPASSRALFESEDSAVRLTFASICDFGYRLTAEFVALPEPGKKDIHGSVAISVVMRPTRACPLPH